MISRFVFQMTTIERAEYLLGRRKNGNCFDDHYVIPDDTQVKFNSALVQLLDSYEDKIDSLVDEIDTFAQAYETVSRDKEGLRKRLREVEDENDTLKKRFKTFTRVGAEALWDLWSSVNEQ